MVLAALSVLVAVGCGSSSSGGSKDAGKDVATGAGGAAADGGADQADATEAGPVDDASGGAGDDAAPTDDAAVSDGADDAPAEVAVDVAGDVAAADTPGGCISASDCPGQDGECAHRTCVDHACRISNQPAGTALAAQVTSDCKKVVCDGHGATMTINDDGDVPVDNNPCTDDLCSAGTPSNPPKPGNTRCNGNLRCDAAGRCVGCVTAGDCGTDTACANFACTAGRCMATFLPAGTAIATQTPHDCRRYQCDAAGAVISVPDDSDLPIDGLACTADQCSNGVPSNPPTAAGPACSQNGGVQCDGAGACGPLITLVKINEVEASGGAAGDWAELYNTSATLTVDISGWVFKDNDDMHSYTIPAGTTIAPLGFFVLEEAAFGFGLGPANSTRLFDASGAILIDSYTWTSHAAVTYGRCPQDGTGAFMNTVMSTKGAPNACSN